MRILLHPICDSDGDGFNSTACEGQDCNDFDKDVHPEATEICSNKIDEDCDSLIDSDDDDCDGIICDADNDGFGTTTAMCQGSDCDDNNPSVYPEATDICGNEIDEDCDGEDCIYHPADTDENGCIDNEEIFEYVNIWRTGGIITLHDLFQAISIWKLGC